MTHEQARHIVEHTLMESIFSLYQLHGYSWEPVTAHEGGRNIVYRICGAESRILRISHLSDRRLHDLLAEAEFVHYLKQHGAAVADVLPSIRGNLVEKLEAEGRTFYISLFEHAPGDLLADHGYQYREGAPLSEYFFNCGKTLGQLHRLAKAYQPKHQRYDFFDRYNNVAIDQLVPAAMPELRKACLTLLDALAQLPRTPDCYGIVHFDYSDGNYHIDYDTGAITVFDFDNCCTCWYLYDLANLWLHGTGWVQWETGVHNRRAFMEQYFATVMAGYCSETDPPPDMLRQLPLMMQAVLMENILDEFSCDEPEIEGEMRWRIWCLQENIPFFGFFHERYNAASPMTLDP